ncbi:MAG: hypothetical protein C0594_17475 [Marinilabiliales bacterium]|nr:MAG: hypothetical protein C0594_17475 [Marinilabiliales bacterium]
MVNIVGLLAYYLITGGEVVVTPKIPEEVTAGEDFIIEIHIKKGDLKNHARFLQPLPAGFTAEPVNTMGSVFNFADNSAKFTWINMPEQEEFTISYKVHVDTSVYGYYTIAGKFAYVDEDFERKSVAYSEWTAVLVLNERYDGNGIGQLAENADVEDKTVRCSRKMSSKDNNEILVNLNLQHNVDKFIKIYEAIPDGYVAEPVETGNGIFSFADGTAKFMWQNAPEGSFDVSYKLKPKAGTISQKPDYAGTLFFLKEGEKTQNTAVIDVTKASDLNLSGSAVAANTDSQNTDSDNSGNDPKATNVTGSEGKISYSVQICALKGYRKPNYFNKNSNFRVQDKIRLEAHEGWNKYTVGSFPVYLNARDYRNNLLNNSPVDQAFVAAYNNGERITVQEALMIAGQKWYK